MNKDTIVTSGKIILASASPRRIEFLKRWGFNFVSKKSSFPERIFSTPEETVLYNSYGKAFNVAKVNKNYIVIGVDTVVALKNEILGKPISKEKVEEMLYKLSNKTHAVISGITVIHKNKFLTDLCKTFVTFRKLNRGEIESYAETGEGEDKAGGYAVQGLASDFIIRIEGYVDNVIGLPINSLRKLLNQI